MNKWKRSKQEKAGRNKGAKEQSRENHLRALGDFLNFLQHPTDFTDFT